MESSRRSTTRRLSTTNSPERQRTDRTRRASEQKPTLYEAPISPQLPQFFSTCTSVEEGEGTDGITSSMVWSKTSTSRTVESWCPTSHLEVKFGVGAGQRIAPFPMTAQGIQELCTEWKFCTHFIRKIAGRQAFFEHHFGSDYPVNGSTAPSHLEVAVANFRNDAFFCLLKYEIALTGIRTVKCLVFAQEVDYLKREPLTTETLRSYLEEHKDLLQLHPLLLINVVLSLIQNRSHQPGRWRVELNELEARLQVTSNPHIAQKSSWSKSSDVTTLNSDLALLAKRLADNELSSSTILEHARALQRLVQNCERFEHQLVSHPRQPPAISEQIEEIQSTITRAELYLKNMKMARDVLSSLNAVLSNRILILQTPPPPNPPGQQEPSPQLQSLEVRQESESVKTIAAMTLVFLPATFVSAVFSTGIFDFLGQHAPVEKGATGGKSAAGGKSTTGGKAMVGGPSGPAPIRNTVMPLYTQVYIAASIGLTILTILVWFCWFTFAKASSKPERKPRKSTGKENRKTTARPSKEKPAMGEEKAEAQSVEKKIIEAKDAEKKAAKGISVDVEQGVGCKAEWKSEIAQQELGSCAQSASKVEEPPKGVQNTAEKEIQDGPALPEVQEKLKEEQKVELPVKETETIEEKPEEEMSEKSEPNGNLNGTLANGTLPSAAVKGK